MKKKDRGGIIDETYNMDFLGFCNFCYSYQYSSRKATY